MFAIVAILCVLFWQTSGYRQVSVLQKIRRDQNLTQFGNLLDVSAVSRNSLYYSQVTVFAATNEAFHKFSGRVSQNLTNYHLVYSTYRLNELVDGNLESVNIDYPPLWVKRINNEVYVNNALILKERSDYFAKNMPDRYGKDQILHVIDEVLDPVITSNQNPTAYDFLSQTKLWGNFHVTKFFTKVIQHHSENYYKNEGEYTFFVPIDYGVDEHRLNYIDSHVIRGHIIKNKVLFTRPCLKDYFYETLADNDYIQIMVAFNRLYDTYQVKSNTLTGDANHQIGEIKADILIPNIPIKNGVVHLISRPIAVFDQKLTKFPYLDVMDKFCGDPYLNTTYYLGSRSGFNKYLKGNKKYTFFIPRNSAWKRDLIDPNVLIHPSYLDLANTILSRHLIVGDIPYFMDSLVDASKDGCMHLMTPKGKICIAATKEDGKYYVNWKGIFVQVYKPDYECRNGIVHVVDRPFINSEDAENVPKKSISAFQLWGAIMSLLFSKNNNNT